MTDKTNSCPVCSTLFTDDTCMCFVANKHLDYDPKTCLQAAEKFLCDDLSYAKADVIIAQTGDTRNLDYWIDRYFEEAKPRKDAQS